MKLLRTIAVLMLTLGASLMSVSANDDLVIMLAPDNQIILNQTSPRHGYYDFVVHNIGIVNVTSETVVLEKLRLDVMHQGVVVISKQISPEQLLRDTSAISQPGLPVFAAFQLLNAGGVSAFLNHARLHKGASLVNTMQLEHGNGLITSGHHFSIDTVADSLKITASYTKQNHLSSFLEREIPIVTHTSPINYQLPLQGAWLMRSLPAIESHHRLNAATEFAVDFFKTDGNGRIFNGDRIIAENYPGYGQPVMAAAAGTVVKVTSDAHQDRQSMLPRAGESREDARRRVQHQQMQAFQTDARKAAGGNLITLRHEQDGHVEYSSYGHLASGSIKVEIGEQVKSGQVIAAVGDTGDSPVVHLHFQLNAGEDAFLSTSLPVTFSDISYPIRPPEPGIKVSSNSQAQ